MTTQRNEADKVEILSGVFEGKTTGCPLALLIRNSDQHSSDYSNVATLFRPGHADYTYYKKYGNDDRFTFKKYDDRDHGVMNLSDGKRDMELMAEVADFFDNNVK